MENKSKYIQILTAVKKRSDAEQIAMVLTTKRLSACTQIVGPITSIYRWKGKMQKTKEWLCIIKTKRTLYKDVERAIKNIHPYKIPEIIALPIVDGSKEYLAWLKKEL